MVNASKLNTEHLTDYHSDSIMAIWNVSVHQPQRDFLLILTDHLAVFQKGWTPWQLLTMDITELSCHLVTIKLFAVPWEKSIPPRFIFVSSSILKCWCWIYLTDFYAGVTDGAAWIGQSVFLRLGFGNIWLSCCLFFSSPTIVSCSICVCTSYCTSDDPKPVSGMSSVFWLPSVWNPLASRNFTFPPPFRISANRWQANGLAVHCLLWLSSLSPSLSAFSGGNEKFWHWTNFPVPTDPELHSQTTTHE